MLAFEAGGEMIVAVDGKSKNALLFHICIHLKTTHFSDTLIFHLLYVAIYKVGTFSEIILILFYFQNSEEFYR